MNTLRNELKARYSQIPNELVTDLTISSGALRVLLYLFTKPDEWNVYNLDICKQLDINEKTLTKYWKELLSSRWLRREQKQDSNGKFTGGYFYHIGNFTISDKMSESVKSGDYNNNIPLKKELTNNKNKSVDFDIVDLVDEIFKDKPNGNLKVNYDAFKEWREYRKETKKTLSKVTAKKQLMFLTKYSAEQQREIIDTSIRNGYQGLFEPKPNSKQSYIDRCTNEGARTYEAPADEKRPF